MKIIILILLFIIGMVLGSTMLAFENPCGEYVIASSVAIGLYAMNQLDKKINKKDMNHFFN
jgi:hypothetical protein